MTRADFILPAARHWPSPPTQREVHREPHCHHRRLYVLAMMVAVVRAAWLARRRRRRQPSSPRARSAISIPFEKYTLPNGLTVVLSEDHTTPTVADRSDLSRRLEERDRRAHGLRPHVRARDVHRLGPRAVRHARQVHRRRRRLEQRADVLRLDALLGDGSVELSRDRALARGRSHGLSARLARRNEVSRAARHREERAAPELRQSAVRARRARCSASPMYPNGHPHSWPTIGAMADLTAATRGRREAVLPPVLRAEQRDARRSSATSTRSRPRRGSRSISPTLPRGKPITRPNVGAGRALRSEKRLTFEDRVQVPRLQDSSGRPSTCTATTRPRSTARRDSRRLAHRAAHQAARLRQADRGEHVGVQTSAKASANSASSSRRVPATRSPRSRPGRTRSSTRLKRDGPTAEELKRAKAGQEWISSTDSSRTSARRSSWRRSDILQRPEVHVPRRISEDAGRDARPTSSASPTNTSAQARIVLSNVPIGKTRPRVARRQEHGRHRSTHREDHGDQAMTADCRSSARRRSRSLHSLAPLCAQRTRRRQTAACSRRRSIAAIIPDAGQGSRAHRSVLDEGVSRRTARSSSCRKSTACRSSRSRSTSSAARLSTSRRTRPVWRTSSRTMLTEGTTHRTGDQISNDLQLLGTEHQRVHRAPSPAACLSCRRKTSSRRRSRSSPTCSRIRPSRRRRSIG